MPPPAGTRARISAWRPSVPGVTEVLHARFVDHAYPAHVHDEWTLLIVDDGAIRYDLDRHRHGALGAAVTLLPPQVAHDGRSAAAGGFRKRVLYLDDTVLGVDLIGPAVDAPTLRDEALRERISDLHRALAQPGESLAAQSLLATVAERLRRHLRPAAPGPPPSPPGLAGRLRELLDAHTIDGIALPEAAALLGAHPTHLVRAFRRAYGVPPHRYLVGRRVAAARRLLLDGARPADAAVAAGFYDQAHLNRHFRRHLGVGPAGFAAGGRG